MVREKRKVASSRASMHACDDIEQRCGHLETGVIYMGYVLGTMVVDGGVYKGLKKAISMKR